MSGQLTLHFVEAMLKRDVNMLLDMDPYVVIEWKDQKFENEKAYGGGKAPRWNNKIEIPVGLDLAAAGSFLLKVMSGDDLICSNTYQVSTLVKHKGTN